MQKRIDYSINGSCLQIADDLRFQYRLINFFALTAILCACFSLHRNGLTDLAADDYVWVFVILVGLLVLGSNFKLSTANEIALQDIERLNVKTVFGNKRYSLQLTDGRRRNLLSGSSVMTENKLLRLLANAAIPINNAPD